MKSLSKWLLFSFLLVFVWGCGNSNKTEDETIVISGILPITGVASVPAKYAKRGLELAVDEYRPKLNEIGWDISLTVEDSKADTKTAITILNMLNSQKKPDLVYTQISGLSQALKPITESQVQLLFAQVGSATITDNSQFTFRNFISPKTIGKNLVEFISDSLNYKKVGVLSPNTDFGKSLSEGFKLYCIKKNLDLVFNESFNEKDNNHKSFLLGKIDKDVDCIYVAGIGKSLGNVIRQLREIGYENKIIGDVMIPFPDVKTEAKSALNDVLYINFDYNPNDNSVFNSMYQKKYEENGHYIAATTYQAISIYLDEVIKAKDKSTKHIAESLANYEKSGKAFSSIKIANNDFVYPVILEQVKE